MSVRFALQVSGAPEKKLMLALSEHVTAGSLWDLTVAHDEGCPSRSTKEMADCTCEVVWVDLVNLDHRPASL